MTPRGAPTTREGLSWWGLLTATSAATAVVLALALAVVVGEAQSTRPTLQAQEGQVFTPADPPDRRPHDVRHIVLPWTRVTVDVREPQPTLPELATDADDIRPPEGGSFVLVSLSGFLTASYPATPAGYTAPSPEVILRADGEEYSLTEEDPLDLGPGIALPSSFEDTRVIAVPGRPTDVEVAVVLDGEEQTVRADGDASLGRASALNGTRRTAPVDCGRGQQIGSTRLLGGPGDRGGCSVTESVRTPYVHGLGWARSGREYLVVDVEREAGPVEGPDGEDWDPALRWTGRVDGRVPVSGPTPADATTRMSTDPIERERDPQQLIFEVDEDSPTDDLALTADVDARPVDDFASGRETARLRWTVSGEDLA